MTARNEYEKNNDRDRPCIAADVRGLPSESADDRNVHERDRIGHRFAFHDDNGWHIDERERHELASIERHERRRGNGPERRIGNSRHRHLSGASPRATM